MVVNAQDAWTLEDKAQAYWTWEKVHESTQLERKRRHGRHGQSQSDDDDIVYKKETKTR